MVEHLFRYISPDPQAVYEDFPASPFWHTVDTLAIAREILRRRNEHEVCKRAELLLTRLKAYQADIEALVSDLPENDRRYLRNYPDDAGDLEFLLMPDSGTPFRRDEEDDAPDAPWVVGRGWLPAEDQAILALLKVDAAAGHLSAGSDGSFVSAATCLLDAYRGCVIAIQRGGLQVQTKAEIDELAQWRSELVERRAKYQKQAATYARRSQKLRVLIIKRYQQLREELPEKTSKSKIANLVSSEYDKPTDFFKEYAGTLSTNESEGVTSFKRIYEWILAADKLPPSGSDDEELDLLDLFEKDLEVSRKKHRP